jgi:hypothetical protein
MESPESPLPPAWGAKEVPCTVTSWAASVEKTHAAVKMAASTHHDNRSPSEAFMRNQPYTKPRKIYKN